MYARMYVCTSARLYVCSTPHITFCFLHSASATKSASALCGGTDTAETRVSYSSRCSYCTFRALWHCHLKKEPRTARSTGKKINAALLHRQRRRPSTVRRHVCMSDVTFVGKWSSRNVAFDILTLSEKATVHTQINR